MKTRWEMCNSLLNNLTILVDCISTAFVIPLGKADILSAFDTQVVRLFRISWRRSQISGLSDLVNPLRKKTRLRACDRRATHIVYAVFLTIYHNIILR